MLHSLGPGRPAIDNTRFLPPLFVPLIEAAKRNEPLKPVVTSIARILGFDSFMYGTSLSPRPGHEAVSYVFTTLPDEWVTRYGQRAYIEVDPRLHSTFEHAAPFIWDQQSERNKSKAVDDYLADALRHGIGSGVAFAVHTGALGHTLVAFNSTRAIIDELRTIEIRRSLPDMALMALYFHDIIMRNVVQRGLPPSGQGAELSDRERLCLLYAAHGYKTVQIMVELAISERSVEMHMASVRSKLGARTRHEAVAMAVAQGIIRLGEIAYPPDPRPTDTRRSRETA